MLTKQSSIFEFLALASTEEALSIQLDNFAEAIGNLNFALTSPMPYSMPKVKLAGDDAFVTFVAETSGKTVTAASEQTVYNITAILKIVYHVYGQSPIDTIKQWASDRSKVTAPLLVVVVEQERTIYAHINETRKLLAIANVDTIVQRTNVPPTFLYGAYGFAVMLPLISAMNTYMSECETINKFITGFELSFYILPSVEQSVRKARLSKFSDCLKTFFAAARSMRDQKIKPITRLLESDDDIKSVLMTTEKALASELVNVSDAQFEESATLVASTLGATNSAAMAAISKFADTLTENVKATQASILDSVTHTSLDAWDEAKLRPVFMSMTAIGLTAMSNLTRELLVQINANRDLDPLFSSSHPDETGINSRFQHTPKCTAYTAAMVALFRQSGSAKVAFCKRTKASLAQVKLPTQLQSRLDEAAADVAGAGAPSATPAAPPAAEQ